MKLGIITGNTGNTSLVHTNKVGTEPFTKIANYIKKEADENGATSYTDATKDIRGALTNESGGIVQVDRTLVLARQSKISINIGEDSKTEIKTPLINNEAIMIIDTVGGSKNMGKDHINSVYISDEKSKLNKTDNKYIVEPRIDLSNFVSLVNETIKNNGLDADGIEKLKAINSVNSVTGIALAEIMQEHLTDEMKNSKDFIKTTARAGVNFDDPEDKILITDFRGIYFADTELLEAKEYGYFNKEHYSDTENKILDDIEAFLQKYETKINIETKNVNFIDFGHDESGNIIVNKSAKIPEISNGYMFKNMGLDKKLGDIGRTTSDIMGLLNPAKNEQDKEKILRGLENLSLMVREMNDQVVLKEFESIDTVKVINSNNISEISREFNTLMDVAFAVKSNKINEFADEHSILEVGVVKQGGNRLAGKKYGYERERGMNLNEEKLILRMAGLHEIRPLTIDKGVEGGMQVKSQKVAALEFLFDKDDKLIKINNGASLSNYNKTYNKLSLVLNNLIKGHNGKNDEHKDELLLSEEEFQQNMYKGKIFGKDEEGKPKYTGYGLKNISDILLSQTTNATTGEAIKQFKEKIEAVHKDGGVVAVSNYIKETQDPLVKVFRDFHESAFSEFKKNIGIAKTQYMNYPTTKGGEATETKRALNSLIGGMPKEDLTGEYDEQASKNALSLVAKALYIKTAAEIANRKEEERLKTSTIPEENQKYYNSAYIASSIGRSEFVMKKRNNTWWDSASNTSKLQSPKSNFSQSTDKGLLVKNEDGANIPDLEIALKVLEESKKAKKEISEEIKEIIKTSFSSNKKTTIKQGETVEIKFNIQNDAQSVRAEGTPEEDETKEIIQQQEKELTVDTASAKTLEVEAEDVFDPKEETSNVIQKQLEEEIQTEEEVKVKESILIEEVENTENAENELGIDLSFFDIDEEDEGIQAQKASEMAISIQEETSEKAVGKNLLR